MKDGGKLMKLKTDSTIYILVRKCMTNRISPTNPLATPHPPRWESWKLCHVMWCDIVAYSKMAPTPVDDAVAKEHAAAATRNYISQPRLSELFITLLGIEIVY